MSTLPLLVVPSPPQWTPALPPSSSRPFSPLDTSSFPSSRPRANANATPPLSSSRATASPPLPSSQTKVSAPLSSSRPRANASPPLPSSRAIASSSRTRVDASMVSPPRPPSGEMRSVSPSLVRRREIPVKPYGVVEEKEEEEYLIALMDGTTQVVKEEWAIDLDRLEEKMGPIRNIYRGRGLELILDQGTRKPRKEGHAQVFTTDPNNLDQDRFLPMRRGDFILTTLDELYLFDGERVIDLGEDGSISPHFRIFDPYPWGYFWRAVLPDGTPALTDDSVQYLALDQARENFQLTRSGGSESIVRVKDGDRWHRLDFSSAQWSAEELRAKLATASTIGVYQHQLPGQPYTAFFLD